MLKDLQEGVLTCPVVESQQEALADGTRYAYGLITTKCLLDVLPTVELVKDALASGQVEAWALIQVRSSHVRLQGGLIGSSRPE
jgi:hypothetical protein